MADELVRRLTAAAGITDAAATGTGTGTTDNGSADTADTIGVGTGEEASQSADATISGRRAHSIELNLVMSHEALFGTADDEARLGGFGPVPAELAREIVAGAVGRGEEVWLRRLYTSPTTGELVAMDSRARLFPAGLARFIRLRDQICRTPWCDAPIRHIDHVESHHSGGPTTAPNGAGLCEACNYAKQAPRWSARPGPDGTVTTTTPTGHCTTTRPPPLITISRRSGLPALTIDYVLAG
jgi:HNH endonuclease